MRARLAIAGAALIVVPPLVVTWLTIGGGFAYVGWVAGLLVWAAAPAVLLGLVLALRAAAWPPGRAWAGGAAAYVALGVGYALLSRGNAFDSVPFLQVLFWPSLFGWWDLCHLIGARCPSG